MLEIKKKLKLDLFWVAELFIYLFKISFPRFFSAIYKSKDLY
jgi:hypothetical protein